jgi:hypothetical protein
MGQKFSATGVTIINKKQCSTGFLIPRQLEKDLCRSAGTWACSHSKPGEQPSKQITNGELNRKLSINLRSICLFWLWSTKSLCVCAWLLSKFYYFGQASWTLKLSCENGVNLPHEAQRPQNLHFWIQPKILTPNHLPKPTWLWMEKSKNVTVFFFNFLQIGDLDSQSGYLIWKI